MEIRMRVGLFMALAISLCPLARTESEMVETLTDIDGREIRAVVVRVLNTRVVFRRVSDNKVFDLPLDRLNEATRTRLREIRDGDQPVPKVMAAAPWKRLLVELPNPLDDISISGLGGLGEEARGSTTRELMLPEGGWVKVNLKANQEMIECLVHFDGKARQWTIRSEGPRVYLSEDGGPERVVGVTLEEGTGPEKWFAQGSVPFGETVSVELQENGQVDQLGSSPARIAAICSTNYEQSDADVASIARLNPAALAIDLDYGMMGSLAHFENAPIEACSLEFLKEPVEMEGGRVKAYPVVLPTLPKLKYFNNFFTVTPADYGDTLAEKTPALRALTVSASHPKARGATFHDLDRLPLLESLNLAWGAKTEVGELLKLPALRVFSCDNGGLPPDQCGDLAKLQGLTEFKVTIGALPGEPIRQWSNAGGLADLWEYQAYRAVDFRPMKNLEVLKLRRNSNQHDALEVESLGGLERLWSLRVEGADQSEIEAIGRLPNASQIESLGLTGTEITDFSPLRTLVNLKRLELSNNEGPVEVLDLGIFPKLEHVFVGYFPNLISIENLANRPALKYFSLAYCPMLESVGDSFAGSNLVSVRLNGLAKFTNLDFLEGADIRQLELFRCHELVEPLHFDPGSTEYFLIHDCRNLPETLPGK